MSKETGGPAFPVTEAGAHRIAMQVAGDNEAKYIAESTKALSGMTLRDYFAAKAMQGICSQADTWGMTVPQIANESYMMADALLKARNS